ncbi:MAG: LLM class flavin-dependent oxidoreductase, partial [Acidimicrobiales bacterium]
VGGSRVAGDNPAIREYEAYGVSLVSPGEAVRDFAEACEIIRRMWTETEPFDFDGRSLQLKGAVCEPKPLQHPHPPILIGGWGERVLRIVAEYADIWNCPAYTVAQLEEKNTLLDAHCAAIGRDPNEIVRSVQMIVRSDEPDAPAATRAGILEMIDAGFTHLVLVPFPWDRPVRWLADEIVEPVLAEVSPG